MRASFAVIVTLLSLFTAATGNAQALEQPPAYWAGAFRGVYLQAQRNLQIPGHRGNPYWHVNPSPKYLGVYLWDSAFISLIWKHKSPRVAEDIIRSVLHGQRADGRVPHVVSIMGASPWTQPPVLSWAAADILRHTQNVQFARDIYGKLKRAHVWMYNNRRLRNGLYFWAHAYESGIDNSPRFGNRDESHYDDTTKLAAIDLNSQMVMDSRSLIEIAQFLIRNNDPSKEQLERDIIALSSQIANLTVLINQHLWDEETGYYYDLDTKTGRLKKIPTVASFFPLTAKVASREQFLKLRAHALNNTEFNTVFPFPTVAHNHPTFEKDMWRGAVWINTSFLAIRGFKEYGDTVAVRYFSRNLVDSVYQVWNRTGTFYEFYDPDRYDFVEVTRKKGYGPRFLGINLSGSRNIIEIAKHLVLKQVILGTKPVDKFVGWSGLVNTLAIEELGYKPQRN